MCEGKSSNGNEYYIILYLPKFLVTTSFLCSLKYVK